MGESVDDGGVSRTSDPERLQVEVSKVTSLTEPGSTVTALALESGALELKISPKK